MTLLRRPTLQQFAEESVNLLNNGDWADWEVRCSANLVKIYSGRSEFEILGIEPDEENKIIYLNISSI